MDRYFLRTHLHLHAALETPYSVPFILISFVVPIQYRYRGNWKFPRFDNLHERTNKRGTICDRTIEMFVTRVEFSPVQHGGRLTKNGQSFLQHEMKVTYEDSQSEMSQATMLKV